MRALVLRPEAIVHCTVDESPLIEVVELHKSFGPVTALDSISFEVGRGEIVGLLGPNGAGKTTCMRVLAGFLLPQGGRVRVAGLDARERSLEVRSKIGYLPEGAPLYPELRVGEYLSFRARLRGIGRKGRAECIERCLVVCGLADSSHRMIGRLSRGYRQRVGLAAALLGDPELLIVDEPTAGLDPNQQMEVRELIKGFSAAKTVLISSHVLPEIEAVCDRVLIMDQGKIVASGPVDQVCTTHGKSTVTMEVRAPAAELAVLLDQHAEVVEIRPGVAGGDAVICRCQLTGIYGDEAIETLAAAIHRQGWSLRSLQRDPAQLERVFALLTDQRSQRGES